MSSLDEKLNADSGRSLFSSGARQLLFKHMHYSDRTPRFKVIRADNLGPVVVAMPLMEGCSYWVRVGRADQAGSRATGDWWFESWPKELALSEVPDEVAKSQAPTTESEVEWSKSAKPRYPAKRGKRRR